MREMKTRDQSKRTDRAQSELRVAGIDYNPAPDADERLRRLITMLIKVAANHRPTVPALDSHMEDQSEVEA